MTTLPRRFPTRNQIMKITLPLTVCQTLVRNIRATMFHPLPFAGGITASVLRDGDAALLIRQNVEEQGVVLEPVLPSIHHPIPCRPEPACKAEEPVNPVLAKNRQYESITRLEVGADYKIRVWRREQGLVTHPQTDLMQWAARENRFEKAQDEITWGLAGRRMILELEKFPNVVAVEITNARGQGLILYPDWS